MATLLKCPTPLDLDDRRPVVFLAGTIDQGNSPDWQSDFAKRFDDYPVVLLSPRRAHWDASWEQTPQHPEFLRQVEWELDGLNRADVIAMYLHPGSSSPISLLELGLFADSSRMVVCCPDGYWRKGNVQFICDVYHIPLVTTLDGLAAAVKLELVSA